MNKSLNPHEKQEDQFPSPKDRKLFNSISNPIDFEGTRSCLAVVDLKHVSTISINPKHRTDRVIPSKKGGLKNNKNLIDLAKSIEQVGLLVPPICVIREGRVIVIDGNRRVEAFRLLERTEISVEIRKEPFVGYAEMVWSESNKSLVRKALSERDFLSSIQNGLDPTLMDKKILGSLKFLNGVLGKEFVQNKILIEIGPSPTNVKTSLGRIRKLFETDTPTFMKKSFVWLFEIPRNHEEFRGAFSFGGGKKVSRIAPETKAVFESSINNGTAVRQFRGKYIEIPLKDLDNWEDTH